MYKILKSGSQGNAVIYCNQIVVDCGVSYKAIKEHLPNIKAILLTHRHGDHFHKNTITRIAVKYPNITWYVPKWLVEKILGCGIKNIVIVEMNKVYKLDHIIISPFELYHNVPNCGWRIVINHKKIFHATDTSTLELIEAVGYDLYAIEFNYDAETIQTVIDEKLEKGEFSYEMDAIQNHLSWQEAQAFYDKNKSESSELVKLHISNRYKDDQNEA